MGKRWTINRLYIASLVMLPVLSLYGIKAINVDFGTIIATILLILSIIENKKIIILRGTLPWLLYISYIIFSLINPYLFGFEQDITITAMIIRSIKTIIYIYMLLHALNLEHSHYSFMKRLYLRIVFLATVFICVQTFLYYLAGINIPGYLGNFVLQDSYAERLLISEHLLFRPTSFFYEPSHFFEYSFIAVLIYLFDSDFSYQTRMRGAIFTSLGIILSTSGMGVISVFVSWIIYLLKELRNINLRRLNIYILFFVILFCISGLYFFHSELGKSIFERLFSTEQSYSALDARTDIYQELFNQSLEENVLGLGFGNLNQELFYPSWPFNFISLGIIGCSIIGSIYFISYKKSRTELSKLLILFHFLLSFVTTLFMGKNFLLYFLFIYLLDHEKNK